MLSARARRGALDERLPDGALRCQRSLGDTEAAGSLPGGAPGAEHQPMRFYRAMEWSVVLPDPYWP